MLQNERGAALVSAVAFVLIIGIMVIVFFRLGGYESQLVGVKLKATQALYCADSGIEYAKFKLSNKDMWVSSTWGSIPIGDIGTTEVQFIYSSGATQGRIISTGTVANLSRKIESLIVASGAGIPPALFSVGVPGDALEEIEFENNINIDGRNHDADGNPLNDGNGTAALNIPEGLTTKYEGTTMGGTANGTDIPPSDPNAPGFTQELITTSTGGAASAHELLGFDSNSALWNASNQILAPDGGGVAYDVSGLTYINLSAYSIDDYENLTISGDGILIIHSDSPIEIKGLAINFEGILIFDNIKEIKNMSGTTLGSFYVFSGGDEFKLKNEGDDDDDHDDDHDDHDHGAGGPVNILFSRQVITDAFAQSGVSPIGFGGGSITTQSISWREEIP